MADGRNNVHLVPVPFCTLLRRDKMQSLEVIYEDNHIIVVKKQPNIPSQADKTEDMDMLTLIKEYI